MDTVARFNMAIMTPPGLSIAVLHKYDHHVGQVETEQSKSVTPPVGRSADAHTS